MEKDNKKKTLTISSDLKKNIDTSLLSNSGKKSFTVKKVDCTLILFMTQL